MEKKREKLKSKMVESFKMAKRKHIKRCGRKHGHL
jgi:hypothetical protein